MAEIESDAIGKEASVTSGESCSRLDALVRLLEEDRLGFRLERYVSEQREALAAVLTGEAFFITGGQNLAWKDLFPRVEAYDEGTLPFAEFFAVGCAYSSADNASLWTDFLERTATCHLSGQAGYNDVLANLGHYPAWLLLYGAGVLSVGRNRWSVLKELLTFGFPLGHEPRRAFVLRATSFDILPETGQKAIPNREREYTPLLNHLFEVLRISLSGYFLSEAKFADAFARFEVLFSTAYAYARREEEKVRYGEASDRFWVSPCRFWWSESRRGGFLDAIVQEARQSGDSWPPVTAGLFGGSVEEFAALATQIKPLISQRGFH